MVAGWVTDDDVPHRSFCQEGVYDYTIAQQLAVVVPLPPGIGSGELAPGVQQWEGSLAWLCVVFQCLFSLLMLFVSTINN